MNTTRLPLLPLSRRVLVPAAFVAAWFSVAVVACTATPPPPLLVSEQSPAWATVGCIDNVDGETVTGAGPGDTVTGPGVILAFEHAYYVTRDAHAARTHTTPDADLPGVEILQRGIDHTPLGTRYCTHITPDTGPYPAGTRRWSLVLDVEYPDRAARQLYQHVTTTDRDGRPLITAITAAGR